MQNSKEIPYNHMSVELIRKSIGEILKESFEKHTANEAVVDCSVRLSYADLYQEALSYAGRLYGIGVRNGTRLALAADTSVDSVALTLGALMLGAVITMMSPALTDFSAEYETDISDSEFIIRVCDETVFDLNALMNRVPVYSLNGRGFPMLPEECADGKAVAGECGKADIDRSGLILFTSGTTSRPKAVLLTQYRLLNNAIAHSVFMKVTEKDRFLASLPIDHILCIVITMLVPLVSGAAMCITGDRHTKTMLQMIEKEKCSVICGVPAMYHAIITRPDFESYDISSLRLGFTGGSACSEALYTDIERKLGILLISTLGQTETTGGFTMFDEHESPRERRTSVGVAGHNVEVSIIDGEICVKGYLVSDGYLKKEEATKELIDPEGWLHTGDLGKIDKNGIIYVTGRRKDIIIRSGENISANQVSGVIEACPGVSECKVVGVPDEHRGEEICACIIRNSDALSEEEIKAFAAERLESFKVPRYVLFYDDFPRTEIGKIRSGDLTEDAKLKIGLI